MSLGMSVDGRLCNGHGSCEFGQCVCSRCEAKGLMVVLTVYTSTRKLAPSPPTAGEQAPFFASTVMAQRQLFCRTRQSRVRSSPQCTGPTLWYAPGTLLTLDRRRKVSCAVGRAQLPPVPALSGNRHDYDHAAQLAAEQSVSFAKKKRFALRRRPLDAPDVRALTWAQTSPRLQLVGMTFLFE